MLDNKPFIRVTSVTSDVTNVKKACVTHQLTLIFVCVALCKRSYHIMKMRLGHYCIVNP